MGNIARLKAPLYFVALVLLWHCGQGNPTSDDRTAPRPPVEPELQAAVRPDRSVAIALNIPREHHAYLDAGRDGVLIPIAFLWDEMITAGVIKKAPPVKTRPKGVMEAEMGAHVLRGFGEFVFTPTEDLKGRTLKVRTQLCNDRTRVCYPPSTQSVVLGGGL